MAEQVVGPAEDGAALLADHYGVSVEAVQMRLKLAGLRGRRTSW